MVDEKPERHRLLGIQVARGAAALLVILYHSGRGIALDQYVGFIPLRGVFNFGHAGVDFFFVLSGFIIYFVHHTDIGTPAALPRYAWRRLTRIYPIYWVVTASVVAITLFKPDAVELLRPARLLASLLLLPQDGGPLLGVAWTLTHEMLFYLVFALAIVSRSLGIAAAAAWAGCVLAGMFVPLAGIWANLVAASYNMHFLIGMATAHVALRVALGRPLRLAALGAAGFFAAGMAENAGLVATAGLASQSLFGAAAAATVLGVAAAERQGVLRVGRAAAFFGNASYSLYLVHIVVIGLTVRLLARLHALAALPGVAVMAVVVAVAITVGLSLYRYVERPLTRLSAGVRW